MEEQTYIEFTKAVSRAVLARHRVQPILFVGSGLSQRYFGGPTWYGLLSRLCEDCPNLNDDVAYYEQKHGHLIDAGTAIADAYREWAWNDGRSKFPKELFQSHIDPSSYLKHAASELLSGMVPEDWEPPNEYLSEIESLKAIRPHAIVTTNYDQVLEYIFPDFTPIVGQRVIYANYTSIGDILKIHGCVSVPESIVLTRNDYEEFARKKKYVSAKLLTFFSEHPLIFLGYSVSDPNIQGILSDIDEILSPEGELVENIFLVEWKREMAEGSERPTEALISVGEKRHVRIRRICASDFGWVYDCFRNDDPIDVNPQLLRSILSRTFELIRHDIPQRQVEVDFSILEKAASEKEGLAKLFGISFIDDPSAMAAHYPMTLTGVAKRLGGSYWMHAQHYIDEVERQTGFSMKSSDNRFHLAIKTGQNSTVHKYSEAAVDLLSRVKNGDPIDGILGTDKR